MTLDKKIMLWTALTIIFACVGTCFLLFSLSLTGIGYVFDSIPLPIALEVSLKYYCYSAIALIWCHWSQRVIYSLESELPDVTIS